MGRIDDIKLHNSYLKFFEDRLGEYVDKGLSGRIVLDLRSGRIDKIFDQAIIQGASQINYYLDKLD